MWLVDWFVQTGPFPNSLSIIVILANIFLIFIEVFLNIVFPCVAYFKCLLLVEIKQTKKIRVQLDAGERLAAHTDR